jgi:hypothetical protein
MQIPGEAIFGLEYATSSVDHGLKGPWGRPES